MTFLVNLKTDGNASNFDYKVEQQIHTLTFFGYENFKVIVESFFVNYNNVSKFKEDMTWEKKLELLTSNDFNAKVIIEEIDDDGDYVKNLNMSEIPEDLQKAIKDEVENLIESDKEELQYRFE